MEHHTGETGKNTTNNEIQRFLAFSLGQEQFAVPLLSVKEVIAMPEYTPVPYTPAHFLGIINLRGQVISVIDMRTKFGIKPENSAETAVIICDLAPLCVGIVVNSVNSVLSLTHSQINPKPQIESSKKTDHITGVTKIGERLCLLLYIAKALDLQDLMAIRAQEKKTA
jgi:purine-binding chemotaxis protein CheW